jgi:hypothetical protein
MAICSLERGDLSRKEPTMKILKRVTRDALQTPPPESLDQDLKVRANGLLRYSPSQPIDTWQTHLPEVLAVCDDLNLRYPFTPESVRDYQRRLSPVRGYVAEMRTLWPGLVLVGVCSLIVGFIFMGTGSAPPITWGTLLLVAVGCTLEIVRLGVKYPGLLSGARRIWVRRSFSEIAFPVPEFVLQTACDLKEKLPNAYLAVEYLESTADPFLILRYQKADYYMEVWSESKYKQERII